MAEITIYHNPRCGKSRDSLAIVNEKFDAVKIVEYLKNPPSAAELKTLIKLLGIKPIELIRKGESVYKEQFKGADLTDEEWVAAMVANPILIERPIVLRGDKAVIGRPPENVLKLI